jgi:hypothetical protein
VQILREDRVRRIPVRCVDARRCSRQPTRAGSNASGRKLRNHSGRELIVAALRIAWAGEVGVQDRTLLGLWYAPRRPDGSGPH